MGLTPETTPRPRFQFVEAGTLAAPGPLGRSARLALALPCFWVLASLAQQGGALISSRALGAFPGWWIVIGIAAHVFPDVFNIGLGLRISRRALWAALAGIAMTAGLWGWWSFGSVFGPPLGLFVVAWLAYTFGHLGVALVVAAAIATPGCEMRSLPQLWRRLAGGRATEHYCPGVFTPIDDWEARRRSGKSTPE